MFWQLRSRVDSRGDKARHDGASHYQTALTGRLEHDQTNRTRSRTDLVIVIVSWNVWDHLRACLTSIEDQSLPLADGKNKKDDSPFVRRFGPQKEATLQVVVLDNASDDATPTLLNSRFPWVQTIFSDENLGFTGGNNRALEAMGFDVRIDESHPSPDSDQDGHPPSQAAPARFIYFLNPDTELLPGSLWALYKGINQDDTIGAIGPQLRYADGALQSSRRRFPGPLTGFFESTWLERTWPRNPWTSRYHLADWPADSRQDVDWLVGAALLVRGETLAALGGFDPQFFMYFEETDLCRRIKQAGWRIAYDPASIVIHAEGRSSGQVSARRHILFNRSKVRYARKWHGTFWAALLQRFLLAEFRLQIASESFKALIGHKRDLRRDRIAAYQDVLKNGLE